MSPLRVSLDWLPNTNHTGFYVAIEKGLYQDCGLTVNLLSPHLDDYALTPAAKLSSGTANFAIAPSETIVSAHLRPATSQADKPQVRNSGPFRDQAHQAPLSLKLTLCVLSHRLWRQ